jgi:hypothetical protein
MESALKFNPRSLYPYLIKCSFLIIPVSPKKILNNFVQRFSSMFPHVGKNIFHGYQRLLACHAGVGHNQKDNVTYR